MAKKSTRRAAPKKLRAVQTSRHFRIAHSRHTGHITPHRTTSYPVLAMILLIVGVLMYGWSGMVNAVQYGPESGHYVVRTSVKGTAPTTKPTIIKPNNGSHFTETPITVSGSCQVETYVVLYRNGVFSGVGQCLEDGTYSIRTDLFVGPNKLQVRVFSPTDQAGPYSDVRTVYYDPLKQMVSDPDIRDPLLLKSQFRYQGYYTGQPSSWDLSISGGTPPFAISVDWGDGKTDLVSKASIGDFNLEHIYQTAGGYKGSYNIQVTAKDARNAQTSLQLLAIINNPNGATSTTGSTSSGVTDPNSYEHLLKYAWSGYAAALLMLVSFWLGEVREKQLLRPYLRKQRKHA